MWSGHPPQATIKIHNVIFLNINLLKFMRYNPIPKCCMDKQPRYNSKNMRIPYFEKKKPVATLFLTVRTKLLGFVDISFGPLFVIDYIE